MVDYNQSLNPTEACDQIERLVEYDFHWVEEPVAAEFWKVMRASAWRVACGIQTGENWWFPRDMAKSIAAEASDYAMVDIMKIGGVTGWLTRDGPGGGGVFQVSSRLLRQARATAARDADRALPARISRHRRVAPRPRGLSWSMDR